MTTPREDLEGVLGFTVNQLNGGGVVVTLTRRDDMENGNQRMEAFTDQVALEAELCHLAEAIFRR